VDGLRATHGLFPASRTPPDLSGIDLAAFIEGRFVEAAARSLLPTPASSGGGH
jgi:hypothetical protein